jgi:hypothetical protein
MKFSYVIMNSIPSIFRLILVLAVVGIICISGCIQQPTPPPSEEELATLQTDPIDLSGAQPDDKAEISFIEYYSLDALNLTLETSQYKLPLNTDEIYNFQDFSTKITLSDDASQLLETNGFVVISNPFNPQEEDITEPYNTMKEREIPIFITSDSLLHLYHIQFDETLRQIEEREFYDTICEISLELLNDSIEDYSRYDGDLKEAARRNAAYFAVGLSLLQPKEEQVCQSQYEWECRDPGFASAYFEPGDLEKYKFEVPDFVKSDVEKELALIEEHGGFAKSPIFRYSEDYSQYVPRGHYTRSEKLKNYFKAFMWYGRTSFLLKGGPEGIVSAEDAKIQTMGAALITSEFSESQELQDKWDRIYSVTAFYVGLSDDLSPYEYREAMNFVFTGTFEPTALTEESVGDLKAKLAEYRSPQIYGGTGDCVIPPPFTPEQADQCLEATKGFRLMGQRFIPDSYMFSNLVGAYTDVYAGDKEPKPFTFVISGAGRPIRGFPRGLDVMALLGSDRAKELLDELDDSNYKLYDVAYKELDDEFKSFGDADWNRNLYWSWLFTLQPLLKEYGTGYPTFMQTTAWQDKELTTALTSWTELRHDTILYAKQSYTMAESSMPMPTPEKKVVGYVEPVPEFYNRLLALTQMTTDGLDSMNVLDDVSAHRLERLETILERLVLLSEKELANEELTEADYEFIENFGDELNAVISEVDDKAKKTTIVADVHTEGNTQQVLEEGVGYVEVIVVAYKVPDGRILIGAGPVMSYYEFKQPMQERLTDEQWREMLSTEPPERPEWYANFAT